MPDVLHLEFFDGGFDPKKIPILAGLKSLLKVRREVRCLVCGELIRGEGVERYGKRFCRSWHADFYRPPPPWWRRLRWPRDDGYTGGGGCCG